MLFRSPTACTSLEDKPKWIAIFVLALVTILAMGRSSYAADICWQSGVTPEGHHFRVLYMPRQVIAAAASGRPHNYVAVAVAFPGWIWATDDIPCSRIPWKHEMMHLDGWDHDANGRWTGKRDVEFTANDLPPPSWQIVKTEEGYVAVRDTLVAALPADAD